jgi:hypothetical protein
MARQVSLAADQNCARTLDLVGICSAQGSLHTINLRFPRRCKQRISSICRNSSREILLLAVQNKSGFAVMSSDRNTSIVMDHLAGETFAALAEKWSIHPSRVHQIYKATLSKLGFNPNESAKLYEPKPTLRLVGLKLQRLRQNATEGFAGSWTQAETPRAFHTWNGYRNYAG